MAVVSPLATGLWACVRLNRRAPRWFPRGLAGQLRFWQGRLDRRLTSRWLAPFPQDICFREQWLEFGAAGFHGLLRLAHLAFSRLLLILAPP